MYLHFSSTKKYSVLLVFYQPWTYLGA